MPRLPLLLAAALVTLAFGPVRCPHAGGAVRSELVARAGFTEPHTPGAPGPLAFEAGPKLEALLGPDPDLNRVHTVRFRPARRGPKPRAVLILVPGFVGGASSLRPLATDLVSTLSPRLEVWVVDRRPNQLEDRLGTRALRAALPASGPPEREALAEALRFQFPGSDLDEDGTPDPPAQLVDEFGATRDFIRFAQNDVRFMAHWGVDTYMRDWKILVDEARERVGRHGLVLFGGHSQGTGWTGLFAAYDFDPGPGVDAGYEHVDGLLLLEGGGPGEGDEVKPSRDEYLDTLDFLETSRRADVFLASASGLPLVDLGAAAEMAGPLGLELPDEPSLLQRSTFFNFVSLLFLIGFDTTNEGALGFFIDDDFQPVGAFRASVGFSDDGPNQRLPDLFGDGAFYRATAPPDGALRTWRAFDDPGLPSCPPNDPEVSPGCALQPGQREVTDLRELMHVQTGAANFIEWYFAAGRPELDFSYGRDSSALGDESLLAVTQNAAVDVPVLGIGGSNGLTPSAESFADYLGSIATPPEWQQVVILDGYAHLDPVLADANEAVPIVADWVKRLGLERRCKGRGHFGRLRARACRR